jgi:uncharacterized Zn-finger protein
VRYGILAAGFHNRIKEDTCVPNPDTAATAGQDNLIQPNAQNHYEVSRSDLPLHCPMEGMSLWNSHPRVYLPIEDSGKAKCPYCGADYTLKD